MELVEDRGVEGDGFFDGAAAIGVEFDEFVDLEATGEGGEGENAEDEEEGTREIFHSGDGERGIVERQGWFLMGASGQFGRLVLVGGGVIKKDDRMSAEPDHLIQACPSCGALIDGAEAEPFALVECPSCRGNVRLRRFFDHFEIEEELGVGGMGTVYRALDRNLGRSVALKLLQKEQSKNPEFIAQFAREAAITAAINHPHVVKVFSTGQDHGLVYIAMELVDQGSLDERLTRSKILEEAEVLTMGIQVAEGLNAAFQRGLIHRDVKPGNILFSNAKTAKIVDFGLAVLLEHAGTVMGEIWGTPAYVAPEKLDNRREDLRSDIYSLGATLFHALAGVPPCDLETNQMGVLLEAKRKQPALRTLAKGVSEATAFAIDKTLKFEPGERFQSYEELIKALEYARREVLARGAGRVKPVSKKAFPVMPILMGAVILLGLGWYYLSGTKEGGVDAVEEVAGKGGGIDTKYRAAQMLLAGSDGGKAAAAFRVLEAMPNVPQPRLNWITLNAGMAEFLGGRVGEGRAELAKMAERGVFSTDPAETRLANFFVGVAKLGAGESAVELSEMKRLDLEGEEVVGYLVGALKDWAMRDFEKAEGLFEQFRVEAKASKVSWVQEYLVLAEPYLRDYAICGAATSVARRAEEGGSLTGYEEALAEVEKAAGKLTYPGALGARLVPYTKGLRKKIAEAKIAEAARAIAQEETEKKNLGELKGKMVILCGQLRYAEALALAKGLAIQNESGKRLRGSMVTKAEWLAMFKATLINDLVKVGYPEALIRKPNQVILGGVRKAQETQVEVVSQFGSLPVPWADISSDCIFAMGQYFLRMGATPEARADRQWLLGVYALFVGKDAQGKELLILASRGKDEYRSQIGLFPGIAESL